MLDKSVPIGFNCDTRKPLGFESAGKNADMFMAKYETGPAISIAKRFEIKPGNANNVRKCFFRKCFFFKLF